MYENEWVLSTKYDQKKMLHKNNNFSKLFWKLNNENLLFLLINFLVVVQIHYIMQNVTVTIADAK